MEPHVLLCTRDQLVIEAVEVSAAALDVPVRVEGDAAGLRDGWAGASVRLLGVDAATRWGLAGPGGAFVVGTSPEELARCSSELGVPVLALPDASGRLAALIADAVRERTGRGVIVAVLGASGGLGASTLVASLALLAARSGGPAVAVDLAPGSGGIDLLVGAEGVDGIRWPDLARARGELGDITDALPRVGAAAILAPGRGKGVPPPREGVSVVLEALARSARFAFVDAGRGPAPAGADLVVLLVGADVSSIAAAQSLGSDSRPAGLIVRRGRGRSIPADVVGRTLGLECMGVLGEHRALPRLAELGLPPVPGPARRYAREVSVVLKRVNDA